MKQMKKLLKRDRLLGLIFLTVLLVAMGETVSGEWVRDLNSYIRILARIKETWGQPDSPYKATYDFVGGDITKVFSPLRLILSMAIAICHITLIGIVARDVLREVGNCRETAKLLPVKSTQRLLYDYVSGLAVMTGAFLIQMVMVRVAFSYVEKQVGIDCMDWQLFPGFYLKMLLVIFTEYTLIRLCILLSNHLVAALATYGLVKAACITAMQVGIWPLGTIWPVEMMVRQYVYPSDDLHDYSHPMVWVIMGAVLVILLFCVILAERKRDLAAEGFYPSRVIHGIMLVVFFVCLLNWFLGTSFLFRSKVLAWTYALTFSGVFTVGAYLLSRPRHRKEFPVIQKRRSAGDEG